MTLSLSKKDKELEWQQKQIQEATETMETQLRSVCDQLEQSFEALREKDKLLDIQERQRRSHEEKTEEQMNALRRDLECIEVILKEKDFLIESQKEVIEIFQKQERESEQQKEILQHLQLVLKEREQEIVSLEKQLDACKEKEEQHEAEQENLQAAKLSLEERETKIGILEEALSKLQQQKEEAVLQTKALLQKLEDAESSLESIDQEVVSLQKSVQDLEEQNASEGKCVLDLLKQNDSTVQWTEKAQALTLALSKSEIANRTLREEIAVLQSRVSEGDKEEHHLQHQLSLLSASPQAAEHKQLSWLLEKRILSQQLEWLQRAVTRLEDEKTELKQHNAELCRTLEQVECERRTLKRYFRRQSIPDALGFSVSASDRHKMPPSRQVSLLQTQLAQEQELEQGRTERRASLTACVQ
ncbi:centrosome-associated protein CEP250-like [Phaenicophaeus curvirostris]|uniref:centrosome-associated protein CEP250-like n=1 Tax=Phaenicophaeus curvirostris TaxID=33595 RepID=UPI0037F0B585